jgi:hypothetical protein
MNKTSAEFNQLAATQWETITSGVQASAFHGQIVAYQTDTPYFGDRNNQLQSSASVYFGYVDKFGRTWRQPEDRGPRLSKIVKSGGVQGLCAVTETMLNYEGSTATLRMREATQAELDLVRQSVVTGVAEIEHANSQAAQVLGVTVRKVKKNSPTP